MQRDSVRLTTAAGPPAVKVDVPLGVFTAGDVATYDGTQVKGASVASLTQALMLKIASLRA